MNNDRTQQDQIIVERFEASPLMQATTEEQWNTFGSSMFSLSDLRALRDVARERKRRQEEQVEMWAEEAARAADGVTTFEDLERDARHVWARYVSVEITLDSLLNYALTHAEWPPPAYEDLPEGIKEQMKERGEKKGPGRPSTIDDPGAYPAEMLRAVLDWTNDPNNRANPFRGNNSLCGYVATRVAEKAGYEAGHEPPQSKIKSRLRSLVESLGIDLSHGPTNTRSYFEARSEIQAAMKERGIDRR